MSGQSFVDEEEFNTEVQKYYSKHNENSKKLEWSFERIQEIIKCLDEYNAAKALRKRPSNKQYHYGNKYDVLYVDNQRVLVLKMKNSSDPVVQILPTTEYYQRLLTAHIATGHGRRDKLIQAFKDKYVIPIFAITIFLSLCKGCHSNRGYRNAIVKPMLPGDFSERDEIDFKSEGEDFKPLIQFQDCGLPTYPPEIVSTFSLKSQIDPEQALRDVQPPRKRLKREDEISPETLKMIKQVKESDDDASIFGAFVACAIRNLKKDQSKKMMKRQIQRIILEIEEQDDD